MAESRVLFNEALLDTKVHDRERFTCGKEPLDRYIRAQAGQDVKRGLAVVHVMVPSGEPSRIAGYYTLSSMAVELTGLPPKTAKGVPYSEVPCFLIGRLAVATEFQGSGLGKHLLSAALHKCRDVATNYVAGRIIVVDALDEDAAAFYQKYGFAPLQATKGYPTRLMLPIESLPPRE